MQGPGLSTPFRPHLLRGPEAASTPPSGNFQSRKNSKNKEQRNSQQVLDAEPKKLEYIGDHSRFTPGSAEPAPRLRAANTAYASSSTTGNPSGTYRRIERSCSSHIATTSFGEEKVDDS
jgi:hypothetical protein